MRLREVQPPRALFRPTALDRVISWFDPERGRRRLQARASIAMAAKYSGADRTRRWRKGWSIADGDADSQIVPDLADMRSDSRDLLRDNSIANGILNTKCTHVVGTGLQLRAQIDREVLGLADAAADAWESRTEAEWRMFAGRECDLHRNLTFGAIQELLLRSSLESGDCLLTTPVVERAGSPYSLKLQVVEADRVCNPDNAADTESMVAGVEKDADGAPRYYHVMRSHPGSSITMVRREWDRVPVFGKSGRRRAVLFFHKKRPGQTRGVPDLAVVVEEIKQFSRFSKAHVEKAVIQALFTVFIETQNGLGLEPPTVYGETQDATSAAGNQTDVRLGSGNIVDLRPGETAKFPAPSAPDANADAFLQSMATQIGAAVEVPREVMLKLFSTSYTASKAAMLELWRFVQVHRKRLADDVCRFVYELFLDEAVALGRIYAPGYLDGDPLVRAAWLGSEWVGPAKGDMREDQQVRAAEARVSMGVSSLAREAIALVGADWEREHRQRVKEVRARRADKLEPELEQQQGEIS